MEKQLMFNYKFLFYTFFSIFIISCSGTNATTMEYRSATTAVRSERDLKKGEEYALKALYMPEHANDARVAYFLAIEIYKPRRNWEKMNEMLDIAITRNPNQKLERPFRLDDGTIVTTIAESTTIYKEQVWMNLFNQTVELVDAERYTDAINKINLAKSVLKKTDNYITSCLLNIQINDMMAAKEDLDNAIKMAPNNARVLEIAGDFAQNEEDFESAISFYKKAINLAGKKSVIIEKLIFIYVEKELYDDAIDLSATLIDENPDDPDIYFNVGIIYQRLASKLYDDSVSLWKEITQQAKPNEDDIQLIYVNLKKTLEMVRQALGYFMDSSMLEEEENSETEKAMDEMKRTRKTINDIYLDSIRQIAKENEVELN